MAIRAFDAHSLDVEAFATEGASLSGEWPLESLARVMESAVSDSPPDAFRPVAWTAAGERRDQRGSEQPLIWLHLSADATVALQCQRCLAPVAVPLEVRHTFRFVHGGEDAAAQIDASSDEDVLAMTRALDLRELIEDELLLAMPLVPLHPVCPEPLKVPEADVPAERENPFAALATLKRTGPAN